MSILECEYLVYYPKTKKIESYKYVSVIPLKDFYNRKLRNVKSCIISYNTKETSLVIDNYSVVEYCMWEDALEYFNNKNKDEIKKAFNRHKKMFLQISILLLFILIVFVFVSHINNNYSGIIGVKDGGSFIEFNESLFVAERQTINDESIVGRWIDDDSGCIIIFSSNHSYYSPRSSYTYYGGIWKIENNHTLVMLDETHYTKYAWGVIETDSGTIENGTIARGSIKNGKLILTSYVTVDNQTGFPEGEFRPD